MKKQKDETPQADNALLDRLGELGRRLGPTLLPLVLELGERLLRRQGAPGAAQSAPAGGETFDKGFDVGEKAISAHLDCLTRLLADRQGAANPAGPAP